MCGYGDCPLIVHKVNNQATCPCFELVNRHTVFNGLFDTMPIDFLLRVNTTDDVFVSVNHGHNISGVPPNICIYEHQVRGFLLVEKAMCKSVSATLNEAFVEHAAKAHVYIVCPHNCRHVDQ